MKISTLLMMFPLLMPASVLAGTVLYTDSHHPPTNIDASVSVIYLDGPEQVQTQLFGELSSNPDEATRQAQAVLKSPQWQANEQQLVTVYRAVVRAWELGVKKVPAVVFDDIDVVYGTADVARAVALRAQALGGQ
ncbi:TIGR03757 family integrating conjugative element protein [Pluralibacter gergoviae]|uniref:TIGR03757 family integrating conjugative element protein n=1 Tax=Enterobacterales TaxID=91347 RepID=UPI0007CCC805|nr:MULTISPECIES: TIGR03757 family integrating conjugative element protein [Enterobacterales]EKV9909453.1 TIGR03757 family integrating conjugative element protein [Pluralibacter gergoviae]SAQ03402.1 integrating conjugative element protein%2C PFL_4709 family [Klebsiella oxytoca]HBX4000055.1 TIGR03757 family integrating conjugative element protein [Klebsiella variicola]ELD4333507.1 TIGR03757 family integrating conjugative element protein [Pluralibacter gergoviae]MBZ6860917.1 TIGR03757 family inte